MNSLPRKSGLPDSRTYEDAAGQARGAYGRRGAPSSGDTVRLFDRDPR